MGNFLSINYWFSARPGSLDQTALMILTIMLFIFLAVALFIYFTKRTHKRSLYYKLWTSIQNFSITNLFLGIVLVFFSYERIPVLSARILYLVWLVSMIVWAVFIAKHVNKIPKIKENLAKEKEYNKYIP